MSIKALKHGLLALPFLVPAFAGAAVKFFNPTIIDSVPTLLSQTGIYTSINSKTFDTAVKYFEVNAALWSDAAHKDRWIILPPGSRIPYVDTTDVLDFPEGTIFVKLFSHDTVPGNAGSRVHWETRLLVKKTDAFGKVWHGFTYRWNATGTEAHRVSLENGFDTVVVLGGSNQGARYRKWHFPTQGDCYQCHRQDEGTRGVLGFFPAQLKRPAASNPSINQITHLANIGVFTPGSTTGAVLGRRWRGMGEAIPTNLSDDERFRVIDTMARAYIAANCSGCHGTRGISNGAIGHAGNLNYDYYNFVPQIEFAQPGNTGPQGLDLPDSEYDIPGLPFGRSRMLQSLTEWGISHGPGTGFDMKRPWFPPGGSQRNASLISAGYPSYSTGLFRQLARKSPKWDSLSLRQRFSDEGDALGWGGWIFKAPWGSRAWLDTLRARNVDIVAVLNAAGVGGAKGFQGDGEMMPPLATYIPDTAALKILGEWALTYRTLVKIEDSDSIWVTRLNGTLAKVPAGIPSIRNGMLIAPEGWTGKATMASLNGRSYTLASAGRGRYALPAGAPAGVYIFRIGDRAFRASIMR